MKKLLYPIAFALTAFLILYSCSTEEEDTTPPPSVVAKYSVQIESSSGGSVDNAGGEFTKGTTITITATPESEYVFSGWSNGSSENPITIEINSNLTLTANFEKRKYPLAINIEGEGTISEEIVNTGKTTDYDSGTTVRLTANPSEGWMFSSWGEGYDSDELTIDILIDEPKEINAIFSEVTLASLELKTKSKMFTKGVADTLLIPINIPAGFKNINVFAEDGSISVESKPEEGETEGNIIIRYTNQIVNNVDWDRTIAGHDNIDFEIEDLEENIIQIGYKLRTQPEPIFIDFSKPSSEYYDGNGYRARLNLELVEHLARRHNLAWSNNCFGDGDFPYPVPASSEEVLEDGQIYLEAPFLDDNNLEVWRYRSREVPGINYSHTNYMDLNNDGYEDLIISYVSSTIEGIPFELPKQIYIYKDGEYEYRNFPSLNSLPKLQGFPEFTDFDNDGDMDMLLGGKEDGGITLSSNQILENDISNLGGFIIHDMPDLIENTNFTLDVNQDGLMDIINNEPNKINIYLNEGNFSFSKLNNQYAVFNSQDYTLGEDGFNIKEVYFGMDTPVFDDFDGDGITDITITGYDNRWELEYELRSIPYIPQVPTNKIFFGKIENGFLRYDFNEYLAIPKYDGFNRIDRCKFKDIDKDGNKELILYRINNNKDTNQEEGILLQIFRFNNRNLIDVTSELISDNESKDNSHLTDEEGCLPNEAFQTNFRVDDFDYDGDLEIFSVKKMFFAQDGYNHIWEWNGSKFIKVSP